MKKFDCVVIGGGPGGNVCAIRLANGTIDSLSNTVHPHPTISEILMEAAQDCHHNCVHAPKPRPSAG